MFLSDYAYNRGLQYTTVASSTVLVSTSCIFVFFLSVLLKVERFAYSKLLGVLLAVIGTALTTIQDSQVDADDKHNESETLFGDVFSLLAAVGYAAYTVQARLLCPQNEDFYSMLLLLGYIGLLCAIPLLPMAVYYFSQMEMTFGLFWTLMIKGLLDFAVTDYLLLKATILTNATVANVGLGLSIPFAFVADFLVQRAEFSTMQLSGAITVLVGFVTVNVADNAEELSCGAPPAEATVSVDGNVPPQAQQLAPVSSIEINESLSYPTI